MDSAVALRVRDVAVCLFSAKHRQQVFSRIQLQKIIYLMDVLSICLEVVSVEGGHQTYFHGPYDKNIQNSADMLAFWELSDVRNIRANERGFTCEYLLNDRGALWVCDLIKNDENTKKRYEICDYLIEALINRGEMKSLVSLVYAEPLFVKNKSLGYGVELNLNYLEDNDFYYFFLLLRDAYQINGEVDLTAFISDFMIDYLIRRKAALFTREMEDNYA